jgi:FAD/FMN-containing dehydrogenase
MHGGAAAGLACIVARSRTGADLARMQTLVDLTAALRGAVLQPHDAGYSEARALWNGMIDRRPAVIVQPVDAADVIAAVSYARNRGLPLSVRGGGHNVAGMALADGGVTIDLARMRGVEVDPDRRVARAQGGARLGDLDEATQQHGLAVPVGVVSRTGVAGLSLHGGLGFLTRRYGFTCDNLIGAEIVTADGRLVSADSTQNSDLLWALRGGGGNFGVVTSFEFQLHPVGPEVFFFLVMYPIERARRVLGFFRDFMANAPEEIMGLGILWNTPEGEPVPEGARDVPAVILVGMHSGSPTDGERAVAPLRSIDTPLVDLSGRMPFIDAQRAFDPDYPDGRRYYWKSIYLDSLGDDVIDALADHARRRPSHISSIDVWALGGAARREPKGGSAFTGREAPFLLGIEANWNDARRDAENIAWARDLYADMERFAGGGVYLNFPGFAEEGEALLKRSYGETWERLGAVKTKYDPDNIFRTNLNITPLAPAR